MAPTIIVPLDTAPESEASLDTASALAHRTNGRLLLVSVIEAPSEVGVWLDANREVDAWVDHHMKVDSYLTATAARFEGLTTDTLVSTGNPSVEINSIAAEQTDPVIVLASHARTGISRVAIGSVAASVVHDAQCPVVVVQRGEDGDMSSDVGELDRALVALDGSEFAENALSVAQAVLGSNLKLHLLRVVETTKWFGSTYVEVDDEVRDLYISAETETASAYLQKVADDLRAAGHIVDWEVIAGLVPDHIAAIADHAKVGMIVMSTHGRTGLSRMFMGSVAERVIHDADRPVMVVNPRAMGES